LAEQPQKRIEQLESLAASFQSRDVLLTWKHTIEELRAILLAAEVLENLYHANIACRVFASGLAVSIFRDKSTRTRFSFASAASLLGLQVQELDEARSQVAHGETVRETANMISFLTEVIGIRDDLFLGEGHRGMVQVAEAVEQGHREGVLPQRPAIINLQCDLDHPTQTLADLLHLQRTFGSLKALRGRKLVMSWAYSPSYGKPLSVPQGIINLMTRFGMHVVLAHPEGYDLVPETLESAKRFARESGGSLTVVHDMAEAFRDAHVVYPKSWAPYHVMQERTRLLRSGQTERLQALEQECLATNARFQHWECNEQLMRLTSGDGQTSPESTDGQGLYMHCLPADISSVSCEAGEVSVDVFEKYRRATYLQASHKPFVVAAMILLTRFRQPAAVLRNLYEQRASRQRGR